MQLKGKCALITGGNSGIGLATARRFVAEGARVAITGRDAATLAAAANELGVTAIRSDVLDAQARSSPFRSDQGRIRPSRHPVCQCRDSKIQSYRGDPGKGFR